MQSCVATGPRDSSAGQLFGQRESVGISLRETQIPLAEREEYTAGAITLRDWHAPSYNPMLDVQSPLATGFPANSDLWNCIESSRHSISAPDAQAPLEAPEAS